MMEPGLKPVISTEEMNMVVSGSWDRTLRHWAFFQHFFLPGWLGVSGGSRVGADFFLVLLCDVLWIYPPHLVTVTTRIITLGDPYKASFATVTGCGVDGRCTVLMEFLSYRQYFNLMYFNLLGYC